jgi:hypothetical protein
MLQHLLYLPHLVPKDPQKLCAGYLQSRLRNLNKSRGMLCRANGVNQSEVFDLAYKTLALKRILRCIVDTWNDVWSTVYTNTWFS